MQEERIIKLEVARADMESRLRFLESALKALKESKAEPAHHEQEDRPRSKDKWEL